MTQPACNVIGEGRHSPDPVPEADLESLIFRAFNALSANIAVIDAEGLIVFVNNAWTDFARSNGHGLPEGFVGSSYFHACSTVGSDKLPEKGCDTSGAAAVLEGIRGVLSGECDEFTYEYPCHSPTEERWFWLSVTPASLSTGRGAVTAHFNITERKVSEQRVWALANEDSLTGLPNRPLALDRLEQAIQRVRRDGASGALLFLDLDNFKSINDSRGHASGDFVLCEVAKRLRAVVRESDTVARLAGDEFLVVAPEAGDPDEAQALAAKIETAIRRPIPIGQETLCTAASVGVAMFSGEDLSAEAVISAADADMYQRKAARYQSSAADRRA